MTIFFEKKKQMIKQKVPDAFKSTKCLDLMKISNNFLKHLHFCGIFFQVFWERSL